MKILEYLTTLDDRNVESVTFNGQDVALLNDFIKEYDVSNSTLDEADYDLEKLIRNVIELSSEDEEDEAEQLKQAKDLDKFTELVKEDIYTQDFEINGKYLKIILK